MFGSITKMFIALLVRVVIRSSHAKQVSLSNQKCMTQPTLINLYPNEHSQEFYYCPFAYKLVRCIGRCNTLNDLSNKSCIPSKTEHPNLSVFNMITEINESKTSAKHISCECKYKLNGKKCNSNQW